MLKNQRRQSMEMQHSVQPAPENMVQIPGGTFTMGSPDDEPERFDWEGP
jgi:formylglycine-generating enzyme required for sulfatase activity